MNEPVRQVVTRSPKRTVGLINCRWFQPKPIEHESRLEKHFVHRALLYPALTALQHQPFRLQLKDPRQSYTPDFLLTFQGAQRAVIEVKRSERIKALKPRFDEIAALLGEQGLLFYVVHQGQIEGEQRAQRALLIRRYAMLAMPADLIKSSVAFVNEKPGGVRIGTLLNKQKLSLPQLYHLLARRYISASPRLLLSEDDKVYSANNEITNAANQFGSWFGCAPWRANT